MSPTPGSKSTVSSLFFFITSGSIVTTTPWTICCDVEGLEVELHLAGLDLGQVQDAVDQAEQVLAGRADLVQVGHEAVDLPGSSASSWSSSL